jgi:DNA-binding NtrC family response regulator
MNGIEMLKRIRSVAQTARVIIVSGVGDPARALEALELGALTYIDKPFDFAYIKGGRDGAPVQTKGL